MLLEVEHLRVAFRMEGKLSVPVRDVSFTVPENGRVALVGESGCGKSLTSLAVGGLVDRAEITGKISGSPHIAYIFQNPMQSLNPVMRVGKQIAEGLRASRKATAPTGKAEEERVASRISRASARDDPQVPVRTLRRAAAARDDRDGACAGSRSSHRGRADDCARRDDAEGSARSREPRRRRTQDCGPSHHAQSWACRAVFQVCQRDVRGRNHREGNCSRSSWKSNTSIYARASCRSAAT